MNSRQRGFTLLEVLVAFVVLALVLGVLTRILSLAANSLGTAGHYQQALYLAESQLAEVSAQLRVRRSDRLRGNWPGVYRWEAEIEPYEFPNLPQGIAPSIVPVLLRVTVLWGKKPSQQVSLTTLRLVEERR